MLKTEMVLGYMGFKNDQVHREVFTIIPPVRPNPAQFVKCNVELDLLGQTIRFMVEPGQTILEAALAAGYELPYSCRSGSCTACAGHCMEGKAQLYTPEAQLDTDQTRGLILTCVGYPVSTRIRMRIPG